MFGDEISDQCTNFREALSKIKGGSIIWTTIASFFQGQIIYTPSNSFTDSLVKEVIKIRGFLNEPSFCMTTFPLFR